MTPSRLNPCPSCDGTGRISYGSSDRPSKSIACSLCDGAGRVSDFVLRRVKRGRELSRIRTKAGVSLRELAKQVRVNPTVLSDVEHGRAEASEQLEKVYARFGSR